MAAPKLLVLDIETRPTSAYVWGLYDQNVTLDKIIEAGAMICVGAKWVGERKTYLFSEWEHGKQGMLEGIHAMMSEADGIVTYNGDKFDLPILRGEFALAGLPPTPPCPSIDVFKTVKTLKLLSGKLAFVGPAFGLGDKLKHEGFDLWKAVMAGDAKAQGRMGRYCVQDVRLLEALYKRILPYIKTHPHLHGRGTGACPSCGSFRIQSRGWHRTRTMQFQRLHCQGCGGWHRGKGQKL